MNIAMTGIGCPHAHPRAQRWAQRWAERRIVGPVAALLTLALAGGALAPPSPASAQERRPVRSLLELRQERIIIQEWDFSCGAAALATLLTYHLGDPVDEREVAAGMLSETNPDLVRARLGFSLLDLKRFADGRGYEATGYGQMSLDDLVRMAPAIVPLKLSSFNHFVIFERLEPGRVILADPAFGRRALRLDRFMEAWVGPVAFIVRRPGEPAVTPPGTASLSPEIQDAPRPGPRTIRAAVIP